MAYWQYKSWWGQDEHALAMCFGITAAQDKCIIMIRYYSRIVLATGDGSLAKILTTLCISVLFIILLIF